MKIRYDLLFLFLTLGCVSASPLLAQDEVFIYGRIQTVDNKTYEGPIRWGKEEVYWTDIFNASKHRNENLRHLSDRDRDDLNHRQFRWNNWSGNFMESFGWKWHDDDDRNRYYDNDYIHQFSCQFGEIKTLEPSGRNHVEVELQNGAKYSLDGEGYNDVGLDIRVIDREIGELEIYWNRIEKITFVNTPTKLISKFGNPLYGTVEAYGKTYTGFVQWDHDERLSVDKLDGDSDDGDVSIEFGKIKSIQRIGGRSKVVLFSGREFELDGSNDVDYDNRGIIVMTKEFPAIDVPWREFDKVTFIEKVPASFTAYDQFKVQKELEGTVTTEDGKSVTGKIVFDLDEEYDFELLQGKDGDIEYATPFKNVKRLSPHGEFRCELELKTGTKIMLDEGQDVNEKNQGLLVFVADKNEAAYIPWDEVKEIVFK